MAPVRLGFVGLSKTGWAAAAHANPLLQPPLSDLYALTAVSTTSRTSATEIAEYYGTIAGRSVKAYHGPTTAIANDMDIDMVAVAIKAPNHKEAALPIIEAGKDLFIEWPAGIGLEETVDLADAARKKGIRTLVGSQSRQSPLLQEIKAVIDSGKIGRVLSIHVTARPYRELFTWGPYISARNSFTASTESGATMLDIAVGHFMDGFLYLFGPFAYVSAVLENQFPTAELVDNKGTLTGEIVSQDGANQVVIAGKLKNGAVVSLNWRGGLESRGGKAGTPFIWTIDGEKGSIRVESDEASGSFIHIRVPPSYFLDGEEVKVQAKDQLTNSARAWFEFAKGPDGNYSTLDDAVKTKTVLDAVVRSAEQGRQIDL